jgi:hypothetical protein
VSSDNLYPAVIGTKNQTYYLSYFQRADARGYAPIAWHWPAFWIGLFWLLYRKQYRWALIYFVVPIAVVMLGSVADGLVPGSGTAVVYGGLIGFQGVYFPLHANGIYYRWARNAVAGARAQFPAQADAQQEFLARVGGVNNHLPFIIVGLLMLISMLTSSIAPP